LYVVQKNHFDYIYCWAPAILIIIVYTSWPRACIPIYTYYYYRRKKVGAKLSKLIYSTPCARSSPLLLLLLQVVTIDGIWIKIDYMCCDVFNCICFISFFFGSVRAVYLIVNHDLYTHTHRLAVLFLLWFFAIFSDLKKKKYS
jgi:hypothetical protein